MCEQNSNNINFKRVKSDNYRIFQENLSDVKFVRHSVDMIGHLVADHYTFSCAGNDRKETSFVP